MIGTALLVASFLLVPDDETLTEARRLIQSQDYGQALALLGPLLERAPDNAQAWLAYGQALQKQGQLDRALEAHAKAAGFDETKLQAMYDTGATYALKGEPDNAFAWLERLHETARFNLTGIGIDPDLASLKDDPRFGELFPTPAEFAAPFVEPASIIHEWAGDVDNAWFGWIARNIGDVDGDGVNDVTTSAPAREGFAGRVDVYSGSSGKLVWSVTGEAGDQLGMGIEAAGDTNADGVPDVVAGAPGAGRAYVYSGTDGAVLLTFEAAHDHESFGGKVSDVGDVDDDGHADVLVGAPGNNKNGDNAGRVIIFSGKDGSEILTWHGEEAGDRFGSAGGGAEGYFVVGAPGAGEGDRGRVYVYQGEDGELAFTIDSAEDDSQLGGMFVSVVGDVDADGVVDIYASDWASDANGKGSGRIYVHSGANGKRLLTIAGEAAGDGFGIGPADAGDVDGDGHDDLVIGAWQHAGAAPSGGKVYAFSGKDGSLMRAWTGKVPGETFGFDATGMGDVDGDGRLDFLVTSAWSAIHGSRSGRMYIVSSK
jgi:hypothetical protein